MSKIETTDDLKECEGLISVEASCIKEKLVVKAVFDDGLVVYTPIVKEIK